jgi:hypothetical protein
VVVVGAVQYRTPDVDWDSESGDLEDYLSAYLTERGGVAGLDQPVPRQAAKDARYDDILPGRQYITGLMREDDTPDYAALCDEQVNPGDLDLDHLDAEGYDEAALADYREAIADVVDR